MRKILALVLAITTVFALAVPAMADEEFKFDVNNANFHCNDIEGENGRVWPDLTAYLVVDGKGNGGGNNKNKMASTFSVVPNGGTTWKLIDPVVCPSCGRDDWITFSNNKGVINGSNVQFQHDGPSRRWITVIVNYHIDIPKCAEFVCKNADVECKFDCEGCVCEYEGYDHECEWHCVAEEHASACPVKNMTLCEYDCNCYKHFSREIVNKRVLVRFKTVGALIEEGFDFVHDAPDNWEGGAYVSGPKSIDKTLFESVTYNIYYEGIGDCVCDCDPVSCDMKCATCGWKPITPPPPPPQEHVHAAICENCKNGGGNGNHDNCEDRNGNGNGNGCTTHYYCLNCPEKNGGQYKLGTFQNGGWKDVVNSWTPGDYPGTCECLVCYPNSDSEAGE